MLRFTKSGAAGLVMGGTVGLGAGFYHGLHMGNILRELYDDYLGKQAVIQNKMREAYVNTQTQAMKLMECMDQPGRAREGVQHAWDLGHSILTLVRIKTDYGLKKTLREQLQYSNLNEEVVEVLAPTPGREPLTEVIRAPEAPVVSVLALTQKLLQYNIFYTHRKDYYKGAIDLLQYNMLCMQHFASQCSPLTEAGLFTPQEHPEMWNAWAHYYDVQK